MSSALVRDAVKARLLAEFPTLKVMDASDYVTVHEIPSNLSDFSLVLQFLGGDDQMIDIGGEGNQGWEESGTVTFNLLSPTGFDSQATVALADQIRLAMRGRRLADSVVIESMTPFNDQTTEAIRVDGAWHGWASHAYYTRYTCG